MSDIHPDIAKVFERNDGNRITQDVALGMAIAIQIVVNKIVTDAKAEAVQQVQQPMQPAQPMHMPPQVFPVEPGPAPAPEPGVSDVVGRAVP